ncbi:phospholipase A2 AP-PLA2-II-like [Acanthaster planci]|uniref:Phospholipase A2 n=1 Tax=Acanthaster planci TaxID=133434 RepID=A0A8B7XGN0_ACAPL|nr:phospholipase A2 AP-PLA2-II-like [Acanthaster planci]
MINLNDQIIVSQVSEAQSTDEITNLVQFSKLVMCLGNIGYTEGLEYNGYGCFCGKGGKGTPVDATDRCCEVHDNCYGQAVKEGKCWSIETYGTTYWYDKSTSSGSCSIRCWEENEYNRFVPSKACKAAICECDRKAAQCFADNRPTFNRKYLSYAKDTC